MNKADPTPGGMAVIKKGLEQGSVDQLKLLVKHIDDGKPMCLNGSYFTTKVSGPGYG